MRLPDRLFALPSPVRSLVLLYWTYMLTCSLTSVFTQIFLYERFDSLSLNILTVMVFYTGSMLSFCLCGFIAGKFGLAIRQGFIWSFAAIALSFISLLYTHSRGFAYMALLLSGIGNGFFYLTLHSLELAETKDQDRDLYASLLSAGNHIFGLAGPACATALIFLSRDVFHLGDFTLIFIAAPCIYALGFCCFKTLKDYRPAPISGNDLRHFFASKRNQALQFNVLGEAIDDSIGSVVLPLIFVTILGKATNVGTFTTFVGTGSLMTILLVAKYRTMSTRLGILMYASLGMIGAALFLGYALNLTALLFYAVAQIIALPLMSVSNRVIAWQSMEALSRPNVDFYASMIIRDFSLWGWRLLAGLVFFWSVTGYQTGNGGLSLGLYLSTLGLIATYMGARAIVAWK